jgi:hypothetical protein
LDDIFVVLDTADYFALTAAFLVEYDNVNDIDLTFSVADRAPMNQFYPYLDMQVAVM